MLRRQPGAAIPGRFVAAAETRVCIAENLCYNARLFGGV